MENKMDALEDTEACLEQGVAVGDDNARILAAALRDCMAENASLKKQNDNCNALIDSLNDRLSSIKREGKIEGMEGLIEAMRKVGAETVAEQLSAIVEQAKGGE